MQKRRNNSDRASTLQIALSTSLISISAILLAITKPTNTEKAPRQDLNGFQLVEGADADSITALGNYPDTSIPLSTDTTVLPDAAPTNTTSINVSTSTNFKGTLAGDPTTGVVQVTDAHPAGIYTVTVRAFNGPDSTATRTFRLTVTKPATCIPVSFAVAANFGAGTNPRSVAVGDFNGDGKQDLAVANYSSNNVSILLGDGTGNFGAATNFGAGTEPYSVAVGDFNGDGRQDLVTANDNSNNVSILLGDGAGHFSAPITLSVGGFSSSVAVGDFNSDGKQDLAVTNYSSNTVSILLGDGTGHFGAATNFVTGNTPMSVAVGDFNGDGRQDLVTANVNSGNVSILLGDGAGGFNAPANFDTGGSVQVAVGDFNGDGKQDLALASFASNYLSILLGDGTGNFSAPTNFGAGTDPVSVAVGDFNRDGKQDLAAANYSSNNVSILLGDGAGHFGAAMNYVTGYSPRSVAVGDFNGDGKQDLAVANYYSNYVSLLLGDGAGNFATTAIYLGCNHYPTSVAVGDFNGDGKQDLAVANQGLHVLILLGEGTGSFGAATSLYPGGLDPGSIAVGDFNGDGMQDLAVAIFNSSNVSILLGDGAGHFGARNFGVGTNPFSVAVGDFNGDGKQDLAVANDSSNDVSILLRDCGPTSTPTPSPTAARPLNLSTRMRVQTGDHVGIGGFIVTGCAPKEVGMRGIGPSLGNPGVPDPLADPVLELHGPPGFATIINDNWREPLSNCLGSMLPPPTNDLESAICATLDPGAYTAILRGKNNGTGVGLVEVYDLGQAAASQLANISARAFVGFGNDVVIGGFILGGGNNNSNIVIRGIGPSLAGSGINVALADPTLELRDSNGVLLSSNDNCAGSTLALANPLEACIETSLPPGSYTAILAGKNGGTGIGLVEIYDVN